MVAVAVVVVDLVVYHFLLLLHPSPLVPLVLLLEHHLLVCLALHLLHQVQVVHRLWLLRAHHLVTLHLARHFSLSHLSLARVQALDSLVQRLVHSMRLLLVQEGLHQRKQIRRNRCSIYFEFEWAVSFVSSFIHSNVTLRKD